MSSIDLNCHNVSKVTAEVEHGNETHWVDMTIHAGKELLTVTMFFKNAWMADAFAVGVNAVNQPRVARSQAELMQQLRDSVALAETEVT